MKSISMDRTQGSIAKVLRPLQRIPLHPHRSKKSPSRRFFICRGAVYLYHQIIWYLLILVFWKILNEEKNEIKSENP